jgi:phenylacetate-coenzyme A ligase PaaK-like adenylate-forming protein
MLKRVESDMEDGRRMLDAYMAWDDERTAEVQLGRLREVWADCVKDVPYYGGLVERGEAPAEIRTWEEFRGIPELNRTILQERREEFTRRSGGPDLVRMTSGSTGNPVRFGVWNREDRVLRLLKLTLWLRAGYGPGDRLFLIWGHGHLLGTGWKRHINHAKRKLKDLLLGYRRVDAYRLGPEEHRRIADQLLRFRPAGVIAYASALDSFVRVNAGRFAEFRALGVRFVMPCAEPPPKADSLALLREAFGCPVVQEFGGVDFGQVASKFGEEPFRVFPDQNILEGVPSGEAEGGDAAVVTALYPRYLPLIRYRVGDLIEGSERDPHGHVRSFEVLKGRINDMIRLASGVEVHSVAVFHCINQEATVLNIQMVLEDSGPRLRLATESGTIGMDVESRVRGRLAQISPELGGVVIDAVKDVETTRAGKRRWFVDKRTVAGQ